MTQKEQVLMDTLEFIGKWLQEHPPILEDLPPEEYIEWINMLINCKAEDPDAKRIQSWFLIKAYQNKL